MGEVYRAVDRRLNRTVAIKVLSPALRSTLIERDRFEREAQAISALNHSHICRLYDVGREGEVDFLVMELLDGETLDQRLSRGPLTIPDAIDIATDIADALDHAHRQGVVHRDIKPGNVMLTSTGATLLDFGLAQQWLGDPEAASPPAGVPFSQDGEPRVSHLSAAGTLSHFSAAGTLPYMAPERLTGRDSDTAADLFSLGAVLYEMLTGQRAFPGEDQAALVQDLLTKQPTPPSALRPEVPLALDRTVERCLAKDPDERWQTAYDLLSELRWTATQSSRTARPRARISWRRAAWAGAAVTLALLTAAVWIGRARAIDSIAVLPFQNVGGDPSMEYLSDGITESLIRALSPLADLKVMSGASVSRFRGPSVDPRAVASSLRVRALLIGKVIRRNDALTITVEVVDGRDNRQIWAGHYTRPLTGILDLQDEISSEIADSLRWRLGATAKGQSATRFTRNPAAYEYYLKGRYYWSKRTPEDLTRSLEYFNQAIATDPQYALAYAGLADAYNVLGSLGYDVLPPSEVIPKAKAAAARALALDDQLAEAHAAMAFVLRFEWDRSGAEREHRRSVALNPNYATGRQWLASHLWTVGRFDEALEQLEAARALDPLSPVITLNLGRHFYYLRQYDRAIAYFHETLALERRTYIAVQLLALAYCARGEPQKALDQLKASPAPPGTFIAVQAYISATTGDRTTALRLMGVLSNLRTRRYVPPYVFATILAGLGARDEAFGQLALAATEHSAYLDYANLEPTMDNLRDDPRFVATVRSLGLPIHPLTAGPIHASAR
jgi:eukaryotic-like serine/threonine-protein kinase